MRAVPDKTGQEWPSTLTLLQTLILLTLVLLAFLYAFGMGVNIYLTAPYNSSNTIFSLHYSLGILALAFGLAILAVSILTREILPVLESVIGFAALTAAGQAGRDFAFSSQDNFYSLVMSLGFIIAFSAYFSEALTLRRVLDHERPSMAA